MATNLFRLTALLEGTAISVRPAVFASRANAPVVLWMGRPPLQPQHEPREKRPHSKCVKQGTYEIAEIYCLLCTKLTARARLPSCRNNIQL